jgi:hypothetical protein
LPDPPVAKIVLDIGFSPIFTILYPKPLPFALCVALCFSSVLIYCSDK